MTRKDQSEELQDRDFSRNSKVCRYCKRLNPRDTNVCLYCGKRPLTWKPEFRMMLVLLTLVALGSIIFYFYQLENTLPPGARIPRETGRSRH
jgi:hypothetical protein